MALAERATLVAELRLDDKMSRGLGKVKGSLRGLEGATKRAGAGLSHLGGLLATAGKVAAVGAAGLVVASVKMAGDFEAALNTINTVAGATPEQLGKIGDSMRELSRKTGTDLAELTTGYYDLVSAGIKAADAQGVLTAANTLAIGGLATTGETIDLLTTAINSYGLKASEAGKIADYFAQAIAAGKVTAAELASSFSQVASIASSSGIEIQELAAGYAQLTAKGVPAAEAATQMRSAIVALTKTTAPLEKLQKATGRTYLKIAGQKGLAFALEIMRKDAKKAGVPLIDLLGRVEGLNYTLGVTGPNFKSYNKNLKDIEESAGTAAEQMAERQKGLNAQLAILSANAKDAAITIGSALLPKLTPLAVKLNEFLNKPETRAGIASFATDLAKGFETAAKWAGTIDWGSLAGALNIAASGAKALVGAFLSMPTEVQATIIALAGLNKLTGGAVSGIVGELGKGLVKGVLGMNAGVVNAKAGVVNVIGGAGVPSVAGAAGAGAASFTAVSAAAVVGILGSAAVVSWLAAQELVATTTLEERRKEGGLRAEQYKGSGAAMTGPAPAALPTPLGPPVPPGLTNAKLQGPASMMLNMPGMAGIFSRAVAKGYEPTARSLQKTMERNVARAKEAAEATRKAAAAQAIAERVRNLQQTLANIQLNVIAGKDFAPQINVAAPVVNTYVGFTVRTLDRAVSVNRSINKFVAS